MEADAGVEVEGDPESVAARTIHVTESAEDARATVNRNRRGTDLYIFLRSPGTNWNPIRAVELDGRGTKKR